VADEVQPTSYPDETSWAKSVNGLPMEMESITIGRRPASTSRGFWSRIAVANSGMYLPYAHADLVRDRWKKRLSTHRVRSTGYVEGIILVAAEVVEKRCDKNGDIFGREFRGVLRRGEPFACVLLGDKRWLTTVS